MSNQTAPPTEVKRVKKGVRPLRLRLDRSLFAPKISSIGLEMVRVNGRIGEGRGGALCCADCHTQLVEATDEYWAGADRLECPLCPSFIILERKG